MAQIFNINKGSQLPYLELEPIENGRYTFEKLFEAIQNADVTFTMTNLDNGIVKIANAPCEVVPMNGNDLSCTERYKIQYKWKPRDTKESGRFIGKFKIKFYGDLTDGDLVFPDGEMIVPIADELYINVLDGSIKKL